MKRIDSFRGAYHFLSNFYLCPVLYDGLMCVSSESAFQVAKAEYPVDKLKLKDMAPEFAKKYGRKMQMKKGWEDIKVQVMAEVLRCKFSCNESLRILLLETGDSELVEGNNWGDTFWGVCNGEGLNILGNLLERERYYWKKRQDSDLLRDELITKISEVGNHENSTLMAMVKKYELETGNEVRKGRYFVKDKTEVE